jgi:tellurite resistance protein TehA-like permease
MGPPPASGAVVMATGIVSVDLSLDGHEALSRVLLSLAVAAWAGLGIALAARARHDAAGAREDARSPASLTGVAGTAVLGSRFAMLGWRWAATALLAVSFALWLVLIGPVLRHLEAPATGVSFMPAVATEALAALAAGEKVTWLADAALVLFVGGLLSYAWVLARFDPRQLLDGAGDQWVAGGALAISVLAAAMITKALATVPHAVTLAVWIAALAWLPALVAAEIIRPRLRYDLSRWATVFPLGMYAACSFQVGMLLGWPAVTHSARIATWVAFAVWLLVIAAMALSARGSRRRPRARFR